MTAPHWAWGLSTALVLCVVIWLNGHQIRFGWLLGAGVQLINMGFGWWLHGQWTFVFLALPAAMFVWIYIRSGRKPKPLRPVETFLKIDTEAFRHSLEQAMLRVQEAAHAIHRRREDRP